MAHYSYYPGNVPSNDGEAANLSQTVSGPRSAASGDCNTSARYQLQLFKSISNQE